VRRAIAIADSPLRQATTRSSAAAKASAIVTRMGQDLGLLAAAAAAAIERGGRRPDALPHNHLAPTLLALHRLQQIATILARKGRIPPEEGKWLGLFS
jgi:hypothetical protein